MYPRIVFTCALLLAAASAFATETKPSDPRVAQDCRVEGESNGLSGPDLEQFIRDCIKEFENARLSGTTQLPGAPK
ncbi:MAG: hypothetical protein ACFCUJ_08620 [Thiotrichales bacterium]